MGEKNPSGEEIYLNNLYLTKNGKPFSPVMGEVHISRLPRDQWEDRIKKVKACGINIIASYLFWINHEFHEGEVDFTGDNNIAEFIKLCKDHDMYFCLRLGPWVNAEYRNGGFPDWLFNSGIKLRDNNEQYLGYVRRWYQAVYDNVKDYLYKNGGNIIMIQFDNELTNKPEHIEKLKEIALDIGLTAPIYTATGWNMRGGALLPEKEVLPTFGGYAAMPWTPSINKIPISPQYIFSHKRNSSDIGNDLIENVDYDVHINLDDYPFATCELGAGICIGKHRRPNVTSMDDYAMALTKLGSGCNLLGYYLICGGINKMIEGKTLCKNNVFTKTSTVYPIFNNFFQAPIGEHGTYKDSYRLLKLLNLFVNDYGEELAEMQAYMQESTPRDDDDTSLRYAMRRNGDAGYIFVNHHCRLLELNPVSNVRFEIDGVGKIPETEMNIIHDDAFFFPFGITYGNVKTEYITAQPICKSGNMCFFKEISGVPPIYKIEGRGSTNANVGKDHGFIVDGVKFITLTEDEANHLYKFDGKVYIGSNCDLMCDDEKIEVVGFGKGEYCRCDFDGCVALTGGEEIELANVSVKPLDTADIEKDYQYELIEKLTPWGERIFKYDSSLVQRKLAFFEISVSNANGYVHIAFSGDTAQLYYDGKLCDDCFYNGMEWIIPASHFYGKKVVLVISEYLHDIYVDVEPKTDLSLDNIYVARV